LGVFLKLVGELGGHSGKRCDGPLGHKRMWIGLQRTTDFGHAWRLFGPDVPRQRMPKTAMPPTPVTASV
jgi:hypothetical protein